MKIKSIPGTIIPKKSHCSLENHDLRFLFLAILGFIVVISIFNPSLS